ncbi:MAG: transporter substrate-binding domain-containing protein [Actinomycetota bacterium]
MRPARIITAVVFAAAIAVTGCAAHSTAVNPPVTPVVDAPTPPAPSPAPKPIPLPVPAPKASVLADGHYDAYIQQVNTRGDSLVVDLVQVFQSQAAIDAAIADGLPVVKVGDPVFYEPLAVAFDKGVADNDSLVAAVDAIVGEMHADGTLSELSLKWYGQDLTQRVEA